MKKHLGGIFCALVLVSFTIISWKPASSPVAAKKISKLNKPFAPREFLQKSIDNIYESAHLQESGLALNIFKKALTGFINLKSENKLSQHANILTVIDFTKSSREKRMWIVDLLNKTLLLRTWVAHGNGSGKDMANRFSDKQDSHKSSLGFYITDNVYYGKNGRSLKLDGMDPGFNSHARSREIVVHGADYVGPGTIGALGRLGRSEGCPAVPTEVADRVIETIKDKTVLFINGNGKKHYTSKYLNEILAGKHLMDANDGDLASL